MSRRKKGSHSHRGTSSSRVMRTFVFVLTPFLITAVICGVAWVILHGTLGKYKPTIEYAFGAASPEVKGLRTLNKYKDDDAPDQIGEVEVDTGSGTETRKILYPYYGDLYATLDIPAADMSGIPVYSGQAPELLEKGAGWYNGSSFIGRPGNVVIAGHNHTDFKNLFEVKEGDEVILETSYCRITYVVEETVEFHEKDYTYVFPTEDDRLTLYTCQNNGKLGLSEYRLAKICRPVSSEWKDIETEAQE